MTPAEVIEALCRAEMRVNIFPNAPEIIAHRDRIKAALETVVEDMTFYRCDPPCDRTEGHGECTTCEHMRKLEEACRGK